MHAAYRKVGVVVFIVDEQCLASIKFLLVSFRHARAGSHFGSFKRLRQASAAQIAEVKGVPEAVAQEVWRTIRAWEDENDSEIG